jgi:phosphatidylserine/phosphatidylglycerophosphate/cardiolipin synthase-like enzyme
MGALGTLWAVLIVYHLTKPLPDGLSVSGPARDPSGMEFLFDLTYQRDDETVVEQEIFDRILSMIDEADRFVVMDMFLFDGEHGGDRDYRPLSAQITDHLLARKNAVPNLDVRFITDEINNFYGAYVGEEIQRLQAGGIQVVTTRLSTLRDSNPLFSAGWRMTVGWLGTAGPGWLPHPLSSTGPKVTARGYLKLLNFKANHRKLIVTDKGCLVASANPHDASSFHSNIAFHGTGPICSDILASERAVASFSGGLVEGWPAYETGEAASASSSASSSASAGTVQFVTEKEILEALLEALASAGSGDRVDLAMFYLSHRQVVEALVDADRRGASVRLVLDPNKDAFGREKGGIPNRQVAYELVSRSDGRIQLRWYDTHGEQFHTKLVMVTRADSVAILGGSANLTRRNIGDFNLEANLSFSLPRGDPLARSVGDYFERVFGNQGGEHTLPFEAYRDDSLLKRIRYRVEEFTGFCSY